MIWRVGRRKNSLQIVKISLWIASDTASLFFTDITTKKTIVFVNTRLPLLPFSFFSIFKYLKIFEYSIILYLHVSFVQFIPLYPFVQLHLYSLIRSIQVPLFWHGRDAHSLISVGINMFKHLYIEINKNNNKRSMLSKLRYTRKNVCLNLFGNFTMTKFIYSDFKS